MNFLRVARPLCSLEAHHSGGAHLDGGDADLAVALCEVAVAGGEQRALLEHRQKQLGPLGELLHIEVAAVLARRQGAQAGEPAWTRRHRARRIGRQCEAAAIDHALLARGPGGEQLRGGGDGGDAHERRAGNAHARKLRRGGPVVLELPVHQERLGHHIAQKTQARHDRAERGGLRDDVGELDLKDVAGLRALHEDRAGQGMHLARVERREVGDGGGWGDLAVERVAGLECDFFPLADLGGGRDVRMVAVVAAVGFIAEWLGAIDADGVHGGDPAGADENFARPFLSSQPVTGGTAGGPPAKLQVRMKPRASSAPALGCHARARRSCPLLSRGRRCATGPLRPRLKCCHRFRCRSISA